MKAIFSERAYAAVMAETTEKIQTETGGLFLGAIEDDTWFIIEVIDPGPNSIFEVAYFEYDQQYTKHLINKIANLYAEKLSLIGLWHRHPGSLDVFSMTDNSTNTKYANMRPEGAISALINVDPKFRITVYHVAQPCNYTRISYDVGDSLIPKKYTKLKTPHNYESIMDDILHNKHSDEELESSVSLAAFMEELKYLFKDFKGEIRPPIQSHSEAIKEKIIEAVLSDIIFLSDEIGIKMAIVQQTGYVALVQDTIDGVVKVFVGYSETDKQLFFQYDGKKYEYKDGLFKTLIKNKNGEHIN